MTDDMNQDLSEELTYISMQSDSSDLDNFDNDVIDTVENKTIDEIARQNQITLASKTLKDAGDSICELYELIQEISMLIPDKAGEFVPFSHLTKELRNKMLDSMTEKLDTVIDSVKAAHRSTRSVKRVRLTDEQINQLILNNEQLPSICDFRELSS